MNTLHAHSIFLLLFAIFPVRTQRRRRAGNYIVAMILFLLPIFHLLDISNEVDSEFPVYVLGNWLVDALALEYQPQKLDLPLQDTPIAQSTDP